MKEREQKKAVRHIMYYLFPVLGLLITNCSFDYEPAGGESEKERPDIVMENIEYVRVRKGDPLARFQAEYAERWEDRQTMELRYFSFEQMEDHGETLNAEGKAGGAVVQLGSGDISLKNGVRINVESEDIIIMTAGLEWKDKEKILSAGEFDEVDIERSDGTKFSGIGFTANARNRTWTFSGEVKGSYVEKEDKDEEKAEEGTVSETTEEWTRERPSPLAEEQRAEEYSREEQALPEFEQTVTEKPAPAPEPAPGPSIPAPAQPRIPPKEPLPSVVEDK